MLDSPSKGLPWSLLALKVVQERLWLFLSLKNPPGVKPALAEDDRTSVSDACLIQSNINKTEVGLGFFFVDETDGRWLRREETPPKPLTSAPVAVKAGSVCTHYL